jgi:hypothetical protein
MDPDEDDEYRRVAQLGLSADPLFYRRRGEVNRDQWVEKPVRVRRLPKMRRRD